MPPLEIVFRKLKATDSPAAGELFIQSPREGQDRYELAKLALKGISAFPHGAEPIHTLVVSAKYPTLDDMLAASFVERLLAGNPLPLGVESFAHYANLRHKGISPKSDVPLDVSLEGMYVAILSPLDKDDLDLTNVEDGEQFVKRWRRVAELILEAAADGKDAFTTLLFAGAEFEVERTRLAQDRATVFPQDVRRGEEWIINVPLDEWPPNSRALLLHKPKSLLFPQWSRQAADKSSNPPYLFLVVDWGDGHWMCSTDPLQQLRLDTLADQLQKAEVAADPQAAKESPWQISPDRTLVSNRKTHLSKKNEVVTVLKDWAHATDPPKTEPSSPPGPRTSWNNAVVSAAAMAVCMAVGILVWEIVRYINQNQIELAYLNAPKLVDDKQKLDSDKLKDARTSAQAAVYLVRANNQPDGTAWVVKKGQEKVLVTCAHIAEDFVSNPGGLTVDVSGDTPATLTVTRVDLHPSCQDWIKLWQTTNNTNRKPPYYFCDVALLHLSGDDQSKLGNDLPLAKQATLEALRPTNSIGLIGYPIENVNYTGQLNVVSYPGEVKRVTDFFGRPSPQSGELLVMHDIPGTGGTSGSPIINPDGEVVAVQSAGNFITVSDGARVPSGPQIYYAQRADLVAELIDETAQSKQAGRAAAWTAEQSAILAPAAQSQDPAQALQTLISGWQTRITKAAKLASPPSEDDIPPAPFSPAVVQTGQPPPYHFQSGTLKFTVNGQGALLVAASADSDNLGLSVRPLKDGAPQAPLPVQPVVVTSPSRFVNRIFSGAGTHRFQVDLTADSARNAANYQCCRLDVNLTEEQARNWLLSYYTDPDAPGARERYEAKPVTPPFPPGATQPVDADPTSGSSIFRGQVVNLLGDKQAGGDYVAVANSKDGQEIQLKIIRPGNKDALADDGPSAWTSCRFQAKDGDNIMATVTSSNNNVQYALYVYRLNPVATSH